MASAARSFSPAPDADAYEEHPDIASFRGRLMTDDKVVDVLFELWKRRVLTREWLEAYAHDYADWRAVFSVVMARWAADGSEAIVITNEGDDMATAIFKPDDDVE